MNIHNEDAMKSRHVCSALTFLFASTAHAQRAPQLSGSGGGGFFSGIVDFMQQWIDFIAGPWAILIVFIGLVTVLFVWIMAPKAGEAIGFGIRVVIGGFVLFNLAAILALMMR